MMDHRNRRGQSAVVTLLALVALPWLGEVGLCGPAATSRPVEREESDLQYRLTWVGNSFGGGRLGWVQNFIIHMGVKPDGTVYTWSHWDEAGRRFGLYKDGQVIGNQDQQANSLRAVDRAGRRWELVVRYVDPNHNEWDFVPERVTCDGRAVQFPELHHPTALAVANDGTLMVADSGTGPRQQVLFYDVSDPDRPRLVRALGERGGIRAGVPGQVTPTKFWGIRGLGMDAAGNVYVGMSEMGTVIRSLDPSGKLNWEVQGLFFCDVACADPADDAATVWGVQERFAMDWSDRPAGEHARWTHYTLDRNRYPNDPRGLTFVKQQGEHGLTSPQVVYLKGRRFMFVGGMFASNFINIFRWDGEIMVPSGLIMQWGHNLYRTDLTWPPQRPAGTFIWRDLNGDGDYQPDEYAPNAPPVQPGPFWVDSAGDIWMAYGFFRYHFQGIDDRGNPIYSADHVTAMPTPRGMTKVSRVWYDRERDILVAADEGPDMRHIGEVFIYHGFLAGNNHSPVRFRSGAGAEAGSVTAAGDYVFTAGMKTRGRVWINRISDGTPVGVLVPTADVDGPDNTGYIDVLSGLSAFKRSSGEYLVFVEENFHGKSLIYGWHPDGRKPATAPSRQPARPGTGRP